MKRSPRSRAALSIGARVAGVTLVVVAAGACVAPAAVVPRIAYYERVDAPFTPDVAYYPLKIAARGDELAVLDTSANLGFKGSRILRLSAQTGAVLSATLVPRGTQRGAKAAAVAMDAGGRIYVAIEGPRQTHLLRLTKPAPKPSPPPAPQTVKPSGPPKVEDGVGGTVVGGVVGGLLGGTLVGPPSQAELQEWDELRGGKYPAGLAVDDAGAHLVLVDGGNHRLIRMAWKGTDPVVIGGARDLDLPRGLAWAKDGEIITKQSGHAPLLARYNADGARVGEIEVKGLAEDLKWFYNELVVGPDGQLYMTDYQKARVIVISRDGKRQSELRDPAFKGPMGLAFDERNQLWVADAWAKRILKFKPVYEKEAARRTKLGRPGPKAPPETLPNTPEPVTPAGPTEVPAAREGG